MPMFGPTAAVSKTAVAPAPATKVTPVGRPEVVVLLNPERVAAVVPSKTLVALGKTNMNCVSVAPEVKVNLGE
jgi:ABC-type Fe3+-hydroxamate transport system substrate-binding protein